MEHKQKSCSWYIVSNTVYLKPAEDKHFYQNDNDVMELILGLMITPIYEMGVFGAKIIFKLLSNYQYIH